MPLGARFSIDSLRKSLSERREKSPEELNERPLAPVAISSIAVLGIFFSLAIGVGLMAVDMFTSRRGPERREPPPLEPVGAANPPLGPPLG